MVVHLLGTWQNGVPVIVLLQFDLWAFLLPRRPTLAAIGQRGV